MVFKLSVSEGLASVNKVIYVINIWEVFQLYPKYPHVNIWGISIWGSVTIKVIVTLLHSPLESANNKGGGEGGGSIFLISSIF